IVDNNSDNLMAIKNIVKKNSKYYNICIIENKFNLGIAKALNQIMNEWNGNSFFDKFYKVQNFFPYAIPIVLDNEPPRM
ncbi:hypothetical protein ACFC9I_17165, partial [Enterococcus casseliflavus]